METGAPGVQANKKQGSAQGAADGSADSEFELGLWLSGLESFLNTGSHFFVDEKGTKADRDWSKELRLTHSTLLLSSKLSFRLHNESTDSGSPDSGADPYRSSPDELGQLSMALRDVLLVSECLLRAEPIDFGEWKAWSSVLASRLAACPSFGKLIANAEVIGENSLPPALKQLIEAKPLVFADGSDLRVILPRFAKILKWLSVVGGMLRRDEPLKPTLLIFSRVHEQTKELINYIDNRLLRFPEGDTALFASLDGASYTASMELKKVYNLELAGIVGVRPSPSVYARTETAYSLLNDSFEQILAGFARLADPKIDTFKLFPSFQAKFDQSLVLRQELWSAIRQIRAAEDDPSKTRVDQLNASMEKFMDVPVRYLFYKDREAVERFVEEIGVTGEKRDLVSILHRFGAFLETLLGQVNMRSVLVDHPFVPPKS